MFLFSKDKNIYNPKEPGEANGCMDIIVDVLENGDEKALLDAMSKAIGESTRPNAEYTFTHHRWIRDIKDLCMDTQPRYNLNGPEFIEISHGISQFVCIENLSRLATSVLHNISFQQTKNDIYKYLCCSFVKLSDSEILWQWKQYVRCIYVETDELEFLLDEKLETEDRWWEPILRVVNYDEYHCIEKCVIQTLLLLLQKGTIQAKLAAYLICNTWSRRCRDFLSHGLFVFTVPDFNYFNVDIVMFINRMFTEEFSFSHTSEPARCRTFIEYLFREDEKNQHAIMIFLQNCAHVAGLETYFCHPILRQPFYRKRFGEELLNISLNTKSADIPENKIYNKCLLKLLKRRDFQMLFPDINNDGLLTLYVRFMDEKNLLGCYRRNIPETTYDFGNLILCKLLDIQTPVDLAFCDVWDICTQAVDDERDNTLLLAALFMGNVPADMYFTFNKKGVFNPEIDMIMMIERRQAADTEYRFRRSINAIFEKAKCNFDVPLITKLAVHCLYRFMNVKMGSKDEDLVEMPFGEKQNATFGESHNPLSLLYQFFPLPGSIRPPKGIDYSSCSMVELLAKTPRGVQILEKSQLLHCSLLFLCDCLVKYNDGESIEAKIVIEVRKIMEELIASTDSCRWILILAEFVYSLLCNDVWIVEKLRNEIVTFMGLGNDVVGTNLLKLINDCHRKVTTTSDTRIQVPVGSFRSFTVYWTQDFPESDPTKRSFKNEYNGYLFVKIPTTALRYMRFTTSDTDDILNMIKDRVQVFSGETWIVHETLFEVECFQVAIAPKHHEYFFKWDDDLKDDFEQSDQTSRNNGIWVRISPFINVCDLTFDEKDKVILQQWSMIGEYFFETPVWKAIANLRKYIWRPSKRHIASIFTHDASEIYSRPYYYPDHITLIDLVQSLTDGALQSEFF